MSMKSEEALPTAAPTSARVEVPALGLGRISADEAASLTILAGLMGIGTEETNRAGK